MSVPYIGRALTGETFETAKEFKIVCVIGPRQSGKTTLCKQLFTEKIYVNLEDPDVLLFAKTNPKAFLAKYPKGAIFDEVQRIPELFNYLQGIVDSSDEMGQFILSGSNNFLMQQNISQSLAGRVGYIELLPFSLSELEASNIQNKSLNKQILEGFYPDIIRKKSSASRWITNYIRTYLERDVRLIRNIGDILVFSKFLKICASRTSQLLNMSSIAKELGVEHKTLDAWLSVLESSYILYRLPPYFNNFNKRLIKSSKIYFYDTGIVCHLLGIRSVEGLQKSNYYGAIFENFIVSEIIKNRKNKEQFGEVYFYRDSTGNEVDVLIENEGSLLPIEVKSAIKIQKEHHKNLKWFQKVFRQEGGILLYAGEENESFPNEIEQLSWTNVKDL
jgi:predicted AAA+ superfamily ATPase